MKKMIERISPLQLLTTHLLFAMLVFFFKKTLFLNIIFLSACCPVCILFPRPVSKADTEYLKECIFKSTRDVEYQAGTENCVLWIDCYQVADYFP